MEMFHRGGTEEDEESRSRARLVGRGSLRRILPSSASSDLKEHGVEKEREKTEDEKQLDQEDDQVLRMVLDPAAGL